VGSEARNKLGDCVARAAGSQWFSESRLQRCCAFFWTTPALLPEYEIDGGKLVEIQGAGQKEA
jgi:hypothetical protein